MKLTRFQYLLVIALMTLGATAPLAGCGTTAPSIDVHREAAEKQRAWPNPPAPTRIRYVRSITGPQDWGIEKSLFMRLIDKIVGSGNEKFVRPTGVAESQGILYVADPGAQALWILDAEGNQLHKVQRIGDEALLSPVAVAVGPNGSVYLADSRLKKVFLLGRDGNLIGIAAQSGMQRPAGLAYDPKSQRLYVADSAGQKIVVFTPDGKSVRSWGHRGDHEGEFNYPTYLALDSAGTLLVTDTLNFRVQAFDDDGRFVWKFGHHGDGSGDLASPKGVAFDRDGHIFLVDALFDAVQIFDHDGRLLLGFGEHGAESGQFWLPGGVFINSRNEVYVADTYNRRIQVLRAIPDTEVVERE